MLLKDKVIVISGVGPGMGQALAKLAAQEGAKVVMGARNIDYLEQVRAEIADQGGQAIAVKCDVSDDGQCRDLAEKAATAFGAHPRPHQQRLLSRRMDFR